MTPSPTKMKHIQVHSASPRLTKPIFSGMSNNGSRPTLVPNYMAATASAKARVRSQSAPRQRAAIPEK